MQTDRIIRCITQPFGEYITEGQDYKFCIHDRQVSYSRVVGGSGSFMSESMFKKCLRNGWIVFVDNLKETA